jgi:cytochrome c biogenesis protein CcmG/thiol:disulfide interchange protein DsbE
LREKGNPYQLIAFDANGQVGINWGVYGTPETFLIDQNGIIRYKVIGALSLDEWQHTLLPMISHLR